MVYTCFICKWRSDKEPRRSFHKFPCDKDEKQKWLDITGKNDAHIGKRTSLCCIHFKDNCFNYGLVYGKKILKKGSIPSLHLTKNEDESTSDYLNSRESNVYNAPAIYALLPLTERTVNVSSSRIWNVQPGSITAVKRADCDFSMDQTDVPQIKLELEDADVDIGPSTLQHVNSHHGTNQVLMDFTVIKKESTIDDPNVDATQLCRGVKQEFTDTELTAEESQQCTEATLPSASASNVDVTSGDLNQSVHIKVEVEDAELGIEPAELQQTDSSCGSNQLNISAIKTENTVTQDGNDFEPHSKIRKESDENKLCKDTTSIEKGVQVYKCDMCPRMFKHNGLLLTHYKRAHGTELQENSVRHTNKEYSDNQVQDADTKRQYECVVCKKVCHSKRALHYHVTQCCGLKAIDSKPHLYVCDFCQKTFTIKSSFVFHMTCVHASESYKCDQCNKSFRCEKYLKLHKNSVHSTDLKNCKLCGKYVKLVSMRQHMVNVHSDKRRLCKICGDTVKSDHFLRMHLKKVHGQPPVSKPAAKSEYGDAPQSADACGNAEPNIYICDYCRKTFHNKTSVKYHIICAHGKGSYKCNKCEKLFKCKQYLTMHKTNMHVARTKKCKVCAAPLKPVNLRRHMQRMHSDELLPCNLCGETVKSKYYFQQHMNDHRGQPSAIAVPEICNNDAASSEQQVRSNLYSCDKCVETFTSKESFRQHYGLLHFTESNKPSEHNEDVTLKSYFHIRTSHDGKVQYECAACKKMYKSRDGLRSHITNYHRPRSTDAEPDVYICDYCQKTFAGKLKIIDHINCAHASGSYKCNLCDKSFRCEKYLTSHRANIHFPHMRECKVCGKFLRPRNLKPHMLSMHSGKKLQCKVCGEVMTSKLYLHQHMNDIHGQQSIDVVTVRRFTRVRKT